MDPAPALQAADIQLILSLRLLIARAANSDSMAWWDDESLTAPAGYILERTFPFAPALAARSLALAAATSRHQAVCPTGRHILHLFHLDADSRDALALRFAALDGVDVPVEPITSPAQLRTHLLDLMPEPAQKAVIRPGQPAVVEVSLPAPPASTNPLAHRAQTLAWAYLAGDRGQPVIPYAVDNNP